ncbi:MAG: DEAD/DEAH box helicase [Reichenbachiella sp.]|uniref:DEAD/DEAH box helicase n=1 Tax=Reichenbachiella sp. TaxID=2184521 RepID=UPI0032662C81
MKYEDYHISDELKKNLDTQGFKRPTDIQFKSIPAILKGEDVLAIAQTGTGKTAAFAIPVIDRLQRAKKTGRGDAIRCVVMVPTRELAIQITRSFEELGKGTKVRTMSIFGGVDQDPQIAKLAKGVDVIVTTPGRMFDLVSQGHILLDKVETVVLDEADHMLNLGFIKDIKDLVKFLPKKRQTLFFSATIDDTIKKIAYSLVHKPIRIQVSPKDPVSKNVEHGVAYIKMDDKRFFLERLINENPDKKILIFVRTKVRAERVLAAMQRVKIETQTIHGDKDQSERNQVMSAFRSGKNKILIATDVSARGIDIPNVDFVVNYDLPDEPENYVHRVGRTGRGKQKGQAISFCSPEERPLQSAIEKYTQTPIQVMDIEWNAYQDTLDFTEDTTDNWKQLINEAEANPIKPSKGKKPKKKKR